MRGGGVQGVNSPPSNVKYKNYDNGLVTKITKTEGYVNLEESWLTCGSYRSVKPTHTYPFCTLNRVLDAAGNNEFTSR